MVIDAQRSFFTTLTFVVTCSAYSQPYQPGNPGAPWDNYMKDRTKAQILWIMDNPEFALHLTEGGREALERYGDSRQAILPSLAKIVRLTFHDCLKEEETGMGCNGCINLEGVNEIYSNETCAVTGTCHSVDAKPHPERGPFATDNNNMYWVAMTLEMVYRYPLFGIPVSPQYPPPSPSQGGTSLYNAGASRADLWAFAGMIAIQKSAENYNAGCSACKQPPCLNQVNDKSPPCGYILPPITDFKTGRADCMDTCDNGNHGDIFCTKRKEKHPNQHGNGRATFEFFKDSFKMNEMEAIALMGAHTLGHPMEANSMFSSYKWAANDESLDNRYYINIVRAKDYKIRSPLTLPALQHVDPSNCNLPVSSYIGNEYGDPINYVYKAKSEQRTKSFGPWSWTLFSDGCRADICAELKMKGKYSLNSCCHHLDECSKKENAYFCHEKHFYCNSTEGCPQAWKQEISMLHPDMGLYYNFNVDQNGRPTNCAGLGKISWLNNEEKYSDQVQCPKSNHHHLVDTYANHIQTWIDDFMVVYNKMLENGVDPRNLRKMNI